MIRPLQEVPWALRFYIQFQAYFLFHTLSSPGPAWVLEPLFSAPDVCHAVGSEQAGPVHN